MIKIIKTHFYYYFKARSILLMVIIFLGTLIGCSNDQKVKYIIVDGLIFEQDSTKPFTGKIKEKVSDRILEYEVKEGLKDGEFNIYYLSGNKEIAGHIVKNNYEGKWSYYYEDGKLESEGFFKSHLPEGEWRWYYKNGKIREIGTFKGGEKAGNWIMYDEAGNLVSEVDIE